MKKLTATILAGTLALSVTACAGSSNTTTPTEAVSGSAAGAETTSADGAAANGNVLVAYFAVAENSEVDAVSSASVLTVDGEAMGMTQAFAGWVAEGTGGDLFSIQSEIQYPGDVGAVIDQADQEQSDNIRPELTTQIENFEDYDTIFIGYPIWWYDLPMVMYSFFDQYDFAGKTIIPFSIHNGSRFSDTVETMQELEPEATVSEEGLTISQNDIEESREDVAAWVESLGYE